MKPLFIVFNDIHIKTGNEVDIIKSTAHMVSYAKKHKIKRIICAGDLFDSRSFQRLEVLNTFDKMIELIHKADCELIIIPGNHDKTLYSSRDSFLDIYRYHPNITLIRDLRNIEIDKVKITLLPFFSDDVLIPKINDSRGGDILISHFEMNGSINLCRVSDKKTINKKMLSKWSKVFLGHYHNTHEITDKIIHLPSFRQNNFGEDSNKGFTVIYEDLSYAVIKGVFKEFKKVLINLDKTTLEQVKELIRQYKNSSDIVRFEFIGSESKLKSVDKNIFSETGIDAKIKYDKVFDVCDSNTPELIKKYDKNLVKEKFKIFCEEKGYSLKEGNSLLMEFLNKDL